MRHVIVKDGRKYVKQEYETEPQLTDVFSENYKNIISEKSYWFPVEKQVKSTRFKNFKHSISDGFLLVWENTTTPTLYITEIETEKHDINTHILPQLGDFISFIQSSTNDDLNLIQSYLYEEIKRNKSVFEKIQKDTGKEVHELLDNSMEDLQILLVIDRIKPELSIGLSHIEKAINVKIRKIELISFVDEKKDKSILFSDSEIQAEQGVSEEEKQDVYTLHYHLDGKPQKIVDIVNAFLTHAKSKGIESSPTKHYIGFDKNNGMIFSCVVRKKSVVFYSKAKINEIPIEILQTRDVRKIGHYTNHLPTEIVVTELDQIQNLKSYFDSVYNKF